MNWHIVAVLCTLNMPGDCWRNSPAKSYPTLPACLEVLRRPFDHLEELPAKVEGSAYIKIGCER